MAEDSWKSVTCGVGVGSEIHEEIILVLAWELSKQIQFTEGVQNTLKKICIGIDWKDLLSVYRLLMNLRHLRSPNRQPYEDIFQSKEKLEKEPQFKALYKEVIKEYLQLGYMEEVHLSRLQE